MLYHAQNGTMKIGRSDMDYISFGTGDRILIMLPGLGDALRSIRGVALPFAFAYHKYAGDYKVYLFSRKNPLEEGYTIRDMARDQAEAMKILGITKADIIGVSQGGMIAQCLAIDYPELVRKLVLVVTASKQNETIQTVVKGWMELAKANDYKSIMIDTAEKSYSEKHLERHRALYPILGRMGKPKDFNRFLIQADACLHHDVHTELSRIKCPTFIIGGDKDQIIGVNSASELHEGIAGSQILIYEGFSHGLYEEAPDFFAKVLAFLTESQA